MGRFAWLCVQIDIKKPLTTVVKIGRLEQPVSYEVINPAFHVRSRIGHWQENCSYLVWGDSMDKEEENGPEEVRTRHSCISHEAGSSDQVRGTTLDTQEDAFGPWVMVARRK